MWHRFRTWLRHVERCLAEGGRILTGGAPVLRLGTFFAPTVVVGLPANSVLNSEETFGPLAGLIPFDDESEAIRIANDTRSGLAAYFYTRDASRIFRISEALHYGMVGANTGAVSSETAPFGGVKESGIGCEGSRHGLDDYLNLKLTAIAVPM
ncbi:aldehyde dehydrogenase family protein [Phenylobacterium montanum]|uniref:Aldehyde dehydrogenase family protein n=1 Tax=Phenylobacterium montanum TaxID=2823693 RepID=A0A975IVC4_9CAUL|nr:aldehyde dehydrogenase family protein [Caulobacter sp. S6]QUD88635.1 aldehyde dehydrogenase family protein [Caulobacter sp. S6]